MITPHFSIQELKQIDIVDYLQSLGYQPQKIRNNDYWYLSPLRDEKTASFKVNRKLNAWYDHGIGQGGNMIDFGILYHHCNAAELQKKLHDFFSFHQPRVAVQQPQSNTQKLCEALEPSIKVIAAKPLTHIPPFVAMLLIERYLLRLLKSTVRKLNLNCMIRDFLR